MNSFQTDMAEIPFYGWIILAVLLFSQSVWLFQDAQKRNAKPWFWGIWGLMNFPSPLVLYLIFVRKIFSTRK